MRAPRWVVMATNSIFQRVANTSFTTRNSTDFAKVAGLSQMSHHSSTEKTRSMHYALFVMAGVAVVSPTVTPLRGAFPTTIHGRCRHLSLQLVAPLV